MTDSERTSGKAPRLLATLLLACCTCARIQNARPSSTTASGAGPRSARPFEARCGDISPQPGVAPFQAIRRLATTNDEVRILVYGQSNSEQPWWKMVRDWLEAQYPGGQLVMEEHARGGCSAQCLIGREPWFLDGQTRNRVPDDVFAWKPDLIIFSVYGRHDDFETLVRGFKNGCSAFADHEAVTARCRSGAMYPDYSPAELLLQSYYRDDDRSDPDPLPALPPIPEGRYDAWMARVWMPGVARKYGAVWQPLWEQWGGHLAAHHLRAADLLPDGENLTEAGNALMAGLVERFLCYPAP